MMKKTWKTFQFTLAFYRNFHHHPFSTFNLLFFIHIVLCLWRSYLMWVMCSNLPSHIKCMTHESTRLAMSMKRSHSSWHILLFCRPWLVGCVDTNPLTELKMKIIKANYPFLITYCNTKGWLQCGDKTEELHLNSRYDHTWRGFEWIFHTEAHTDSLKNVTVLWPAVLHPASCLWLWWLWCHWWRGRSQSGCFQLPRWTAGWWRRTACHRPAERSRPLWCAGVPLRPCWGCGGHCNKGQRAVPGTWLHLARLHQHALSSGCWRWSTGDLHKHMRTKHTKLHQEEKWTSTHKHSHTHTHTHAYHWSHTCIHTHTRVFECYTIHHLQGMVRGWDRLSMAEQNRSRGEPWSRLREIRVRTDNRKEEGEETEKSRRRMKR